MKKSVLLCIVLILPFILIACNAGNSKDAEINIGESSKFSKEEIEEGIKKVKKKFKTFKGGTLLEIWYDEEKADEAVKFYLTNGKGSLNNVKEENILVLFSNFHIDEAGISEGFNPNFTYTDWNWILIRDDKKDEWKVDDWGY